MNVLLFGIIGSGKSSIGQELAKRLGYKFIEMDKLIQINSGLKSNTEDNILWKEVELNVSKDLSYENNCVIACPGGFLENELNISYFKQNSDFKSVYLFAEEDVLVKRIIERREIQGKETDEKIIKEKISELFIKRDSTYKYFSNTTINSGKLSIEEAVNHIIEKFEIGSKSGFSETFLYEQLALLSISSDYGKIINEVFNNFHYVITVAILIDMQMLGLIEFGSDGIKMIKKEYNGEDMVISHIYNMIQDQKKTLRPAIEVQNLIYNKKYITDVVMEQLVQNKEIEITSKGLLGIKLNTHISIINNQLRDKLIEDLKNLSDKSSKKTLTLAFLIKWLKLDRFVFNSQESKKFNEVITKYPSDSLVSGLGLLSEEVNYAAYNFGVK